MRKALTAQENTWESQKYFLSDWVSKQILIRNHQMERRPSGNTPESADSP